MIVEYPVDTINGHRLILAEIQIRTLSMNFWATIEHSLNYKYKGEFPKEIKCRLETTANLAYQLDEEMGEIRDAIQEAQALFDPLHRKLNDGVGNSDDTDEDTDKKIAIVRNRKRQSEQVYQDLKQKLKQNGFILTPKNPDIVISVGGDGMLLSAFHMYEERWIGSALSVYIQGILAFIQTTVILNWISWLKILNWILVLRFLIQF